MKISEIDFLHLVEELMIYLGWTTGEVDECFRAIKHGVFTLPDLCANVAAQCFIVRHESSNADVLRSYLLELHASESKSDVEFSEET